MIGWIKFFLNAVIETSKVAKDKFKKVVEFTGITESTIKNIIKSFLDKEILIETTGYMRNQIFKFQKYTDLFLE